MLAIRKRLPIPKMVASGMLVFTVGLTASAAYLSTTIERMPYSFNTQQQTPENTTEDTAAPGVTKGTSDKNKQTSASTIPVGAAESAPLTSDWEPYVAPVSSTQPSGASVLPSGESGTAGVVPAPVQTVTEPVQSAPEQSTPSEPLLQPVTNVVDGIVRVVGP